MSSRRRVATPAQSLSDTVVPRATRTPRKIGICPPFKGHSRSCPARSNRGSLAQGGCAEWLQRLRQDDAYTAPADSIFVYREHIERAFAMGTVEGIVTQLTREITLAEEAGLPAEPLVDMLESMATACPLSLKVRHRRTAGGHAILYAWPFPREGRCLGAAPLTHPRPPARARRVSR
jgi:hypothetical protein